MRKFKGKKHPHRNCSLTNPRCNASREALSPRRSCLHLSSGREIVRMNVTVYSFTRRWIECRKVQKL